VLTSVSFLLLINLLLLFNFLKVSQLILLNEAAQRDGIPLPDLVPSAQQIREAIKSLVLAGQKLVSETPDNVSFGNEYMKDHIIIWTAEKQFNY